MIALRQRLSRWWRGTNSGSVYAPLLTHPDIVRLMAASRNGHWMSDAPASDFVAGDIAGKRPGSGLDFDDNRPYETGDDARYINWRLSARTGTPYVKLFRQEYRPCAFVLLDRRAAMRFATVGHLKAHQGAAAAVLFAGIAADRGAPIGALLLEADSHWLPPKQGQAALRALLHAAAAPAPPLDQTAEPNLDDTLQQLAARLPATSSVLLISDFADLGEASAATLVRLGREHNVRALWVSDPAEHALPDTGVVELTAAAGGVGIQWDSDDAALRTQFTSLAERHRRKQMRWFDAAGIAVTFLSTQDDVIKRLTGAADKNHGR